MNNLPLETATTARDEPIPPSRFPQTVVAVSREEFIQPIELTVRDAAGNITTLPEALTGHYFMIGPVGSTDSAQVDGDPQTVWVSKDGWTALYNGDGLIYRLDFAEGKARLKTRLVKPPCFFADRATADPANSDRYGRLKFHNLGITRGSFNQLGIRNQLNTAFVPFKLKDDASERLLVTWDVGRPYEIDPETLETLTPVGQNESWSNLLPAQQPVPFKSIMASAHPVFDYDAEKLYTLNVGKSFSTMLSFKRSVEVREAENSKAFKSLMGKLFGDRDFRVTQDFNNILVLLYSVILLALKVAISVFEVLISVFKFFVGGHDFVHLVEWDGEQVEIGKKWNIVLPYNRPLRIGQTVHQMGITQDYIVFAETSFKFSLENAIPFQRSSLLSSFVIFITDFLNYPQFPSTNLYIVSKADLARESTSLLTRITNLFDRTEFKHLPKVVARKVEIQPEFSHYLLDYDNDQDQIVLHASHLAAADIAEYIHIYDRSAYGDRDTDELGDIYNDPELTYRLQKLAGNVVGPLDISRLGRLVIDAKQGKVIEQRLFPDETNRWEINQQLADHNLDPRNQIDPKYLLTWSTAFYIYPDHRPTRRLTDIFWNSWGAWPDTLTTRAIEAYQDYPGRLVDLQKVIDLTYEGIPSSICHLKITSDPGQGTQIELNEDNFYQFDKRCLGTSSQFIPRPGSEDQTDGYIVCAVLTGDRFLAQPTEADNDPDWSQNSEIWVFDAQALNQGPLYKLSHPKLNIGFSFHTTWMSEVKSPERRLAYDVRQDHEELVEELIKCQPAIEDPVRQLFEEEIYPHFEA
ncbi:MAG: carotenoid oxygenase family protein [Cyanobacteria bacterium J06643_13]